MLTIFPSLLTFGLVAPFLLRIVVGLFFIQQSFLSHANKKASCEIMGFTKYSSELAWGKTIIWFVFGILLLAGAFTQIDAIVLGLVSLISIFGKMKNTSFAKESKTFYFVIFIICLSLLFSGAGFLAFDLPL